MPALNIMIKPSSGMCNMRCDYCFYCDETKKRKQESYGFMTEETLKNVIRKTMAHASGMITYAYQGGEPTLRGLEFFEKAVFYQKKYAKGGIRVNNALQTNGYALDEDWCLFFHEHQFLIGVSVDGTKATHDRYRHDAAGNGTYGRIVEHTRLLDRYEVDYNILTVLTGHTADRIGEIYRDYKKNGWRYQQYIACLDPLGEARGESGYALTPEQYGKALTELFWLWYEDLERGEQPYIRSFENYIGILMGRLAESCDQRGMCGIQTVVEADGSAYPCDFYMLDEYCLGNFNECRMDAIDQKREEVGFVDRSRRIAAACRECRYFGICKGGCQRHREWNPAAEGYENYFCDGFRMFFDACCEKMKEIADHIGTAG